jgi:hypothetical protein
MFMSLAPKLEPTQASICVNRATQKTCIDGDLFSALGKGGPFWLNQACVIGKYDNMHTKSSLFKAVCE